MELPMHFPGTRIIFDYVIPLIVAVLVWPSPCGRDRPHDFWRDRTLMACHCMWAEMGAGGWAVLGQWLLGPFDSSTCV